MSREIDRIIYQQRFESLAPANGEENALTEALNRFIKTPKRSFNFFSVSKYERTIPPNESLVHTPPMDKKALKLDKESRDRGRIELPLTDEVRAIRRKDGTISLGFSPHDPQAYWKIIHKFHSAETEEPETPDEIRRIRIDMAAVAKNSLYVNLPHYELRSMAGLKLAAKGLQIAMTAPETRSEARVIKVDGISAHEIYRASQSIAQINHPDIIDEGA